MLLLSAMMRVTIASPLQLWTDVGNQSMCVFGAAEAPAVFFCCAVCRDARWAASHRVTRLWRDLGLRCQGWRSVRYSFTSHVPPCFSPFALSAIPSFVSEQGCDPVRGNGLLGCLLSVSWKITAQAVFEEVSSHPIDPCHYFFRFPLLDRLSLTP